MKRVLGQFFFYLGEIITARIFLLSSAFLLILLGAFFALQSQVPKKIGEKILSFKKAAHTRLCASLAVGVPQETKKGKEVKKEGVVKCGDVFQVSDAEGGVLGEESSAAKVTVAGFRAENCDRAEITLRLIKGGKVIWKKAETDSSCSVSGEPNGSYIVNLGKPGNLPSLEGTSLEICFDLIEKNGKRASENKVDKCPLLAVYPFLCQKIPIPKSWR